MNDPNAKPALAPQFLLTVPPEVIRLLTGIQSSLQRLEAEVRDCRARLGYAPPAPPTLKPRNSAAVPPDLRDDLREMAEERPAHSVRMAAGKAAAARMRALAESLGTASQRELGDRLGVTGAMVGHVLAGRSGISKHVHEAMRKLETTNGGKP